MCCKILVEFMLFALNRSIPNARRDLVGGSWTRPQAARCLLPAACCLLHAACCLQPGSHSLYIEYGKLNNVRAMTLILIKHNKKISIVLLFQLLKYYATVQYSTINEMNKNNKQNENRKVHRGWHCPVRIRVQRATKIAWHTVCGIASVWWW